MVDKNTATVCIQLQAAVDEFRKRLGQSSTAESSVSILLVHWQESVYICICNIYRISLMRNLRVPANLLILNYFPKGN